LAPGRHVHLPVSVQRNLAGENESSWRPVPLSHVLTGGREFLYTLVAAVHHENIAFTVYCKAGGVTELPGAAAVPSPLCERHSERRELLDPIVPGNKRARL
jgi:hypothetical protein